MTLKTFFIFLSIFWGQFYMAYPIDPASLRVLITDSQNIVYAQVKQIKTNNSSFKSTFNMSHIAVLEIKETLQGNIKSKTVEVYFSPEYSCPLPAIYEIGINVIAFLDKEMEKYTTHSLSYGLKKVNKNGYSAYKTRIKDYQIIMKISDNIEKKEKTIDWLIDCASHKATRSEGLMDLYEKGTFMSFYDYSKEQDIRTYSLTQNQKERLRNLFFKSENIDYEIVGITGLIAEKNDFKIISYLINYLKKNKKSCCNDSIMFKIAELSDKKELKNIVEKVQSLDLLEENYQQQREILNKEFINSL